MSQNIYERWKPVVTKIANFTARDFPDVEAEDLSQDLFVLILERGWDDPEDQSATLILKRVARWQAMRYRAQNLGQTAQFSYRTSEVRQILEKVFDHESWPRRSVPSYPSKQYENRENPQWGLFDPEKEGIDEIVGRWNRKAHVVAGGASTYLSGGVSGPAVDWEEQIAGYADVKRAWQHLPHQYKVAIFKKYALMEDPEGEADRKRLQRAVTRLTDILNWYK